MTRVLVLFSLVLACSCRKEEVKVQPASPPPATAVQTAYQSPTQAQPKLPTIKLWLGTQEIIAEIAATEKTVETGMMWRTNMAEMEGMLFVFAQPHRASFWMKNTLIPLSCAYIDSAGVIQEIRDMKPKDETPIVAAADNIRFVLETPQGWFQRHNVGVGVLVKSDRGTLGQTFFGAR